jgi:hypothetical protein
VLWQALGEVEETSVYEVRLDADISFVIGSIVTRLEVNDEAGGMRRCLRDRIARAVGALNEGKVLPMPAGGGPGNAQGGMRRLGRVGSIHASGHVGVVWLDGSRSCMPPWAIVRVCGQAKEMGRADANVRAQRNERFVVRADCQ